MRSWREIVKDDDAVAAIIAVAIVMAIAMILVACFGVGCYGLYKVMFSREDSQHVTQVVPKSAYIAIDTITIRRDTVVASIGNRKYFIMPGVTMKVQPTVTDTTRKR